MAPAPQSADAFLQDGSDAFHATLAAQLEASMGKDMPQLEIRFQDLSIAADVTVATKNGMELPTLANDVKKGVMGLFSAKRSIRKDILHPMSGVFKPSTTTLVLGQPGSGKSSLMKILSGRFPMQKNITVGGDITFNGTKSADIGNKLPQFASYISQRDFHYATLSVKETLQFAHACSGGAAVPQRVLDSLQNGSPEENAQAKAVIQSLYQVYPDIITRQMGLKICEDTVVGNAMLRGVSGGERKRVTVGEMEFGMKMVSFMDEISTGLDSAATFDIVKSQKSMAESLKKTIAIALLQPSPEVYNLFDEVLLLNEGHVMYHGPRAQALAYFESLGFKCPPHRDVADFLLDLGTPEQDQYMVATNFAMTPRQPSEYADVFRQSSVYAAMLDVLASPTQAHLVDDARHHIGALPVYQVPLWPSTWTVFSRQMRVFLRNRDFIVSRVVMIVIMSLLYSSNYYQVAPDQVVTVLGVVFVAVLFLALGQFPMIPSFLEARDIYYKQQRANFFRTSSYILAQALTQLPMCFIETIVFGSVMYWITGFVAEVGAFLIYLLLLFLTNLVYSTWFFLMAAVSPNLNVAQPLSMMTILLFVIFAGFIMSSADMPDYFIWLYWIDPFAWTIRALAINQYSAAEFQVCVYKGINYCAAKGDKFGNVMLQTFGLKTHTVWIWYGVIFMAATYVVFLGLAFVALEYLRYDGVESTAVNVAAIPNDESIYVEPPKTPAGAVAVRVNDTEPQRANVFVTLAFQNLWYSVPNPTKGEPDLQLLKGINGYALPGTITALMGSSGAGKTTLMDVIAGRKTGGKIEGQILLNGYPATDLAIRRSTGYCEQMDIHSESATFREAFQFSAMLRQSDDIPAEEKMAFAEECLELLDMKNLGDKIIRGASVEQMKRLTIGVELAAAPSVLFLDEPTSGLDARSAKIIMTGIRKIASTGRTVVCTIHQPSTEVFEMFDSLLLLKRGGETVFFGDLGHQASHLIEYFKAIPNTPPLLPGANPATWMLEVIGAGVEAKNANPMDYVQLFNASAERQQLTDALAIHANVHPSLPELTFANKRAASSMTQFKMVTQRFFRMYWRTPSYNNTRVFISIFLAVLFGLVYRGVDYTTFSGATGGVGMVFLTSLFVGMISFNSVIPLSGEERASFYRERASQTYNALWYFVGSTLAEIPYVFLTTFVFTIIYYPFVGLNESVGACLFYGFNLSMMVLMNVYMGQLMAYSMPNVEVAALVGILFNSIFFLFMGFTPTASNIPSGYRWLYTITPPKYSMAILTAETFAKCTSNGTELGCQPMKAVPPSILQAMNKSSITVKEYIEHTYEMYYDDSLQNILVVLGCIVLFRVLAMLSLRYVNHQKR
ncbi:ATP-binding Cassette (ABC) Superfamily [Achlya hypogyna]|uniref:ATP-binding Cassette (ABC) Superfamily n=1 Tax=Achlya hypogyna TaxID=1202772 RepID=A0A1V9ZBF3_ACHHY|nr:ATP-binding Cassette (ABC) Superfamily [Achlya hypogyna]